MLHWECLSFLPAVRQHHHNHGQRPHCGQGKACAGRAAGGESSRCLQSFLYLFAGILVLHMLQFCPLAPRCWVRSVVLRLSTCPEYSQPGSWQFSVQGPFMWSVGESFVPSPDFQTHLKLKFQNCLLDQLSTLPTLSPPPQINKVYLTWKRNNNFLLNYERCAVQNSSPKTLQKCI